MPADLGQFLVSCGLIVVGLLWARDALARWSEYSFAEDFKGTFLRLRWRYSGVPPEAGPRLIAPLMVVTFGCGLFVALFVRLAIRHLGG